MFLGSMDDVLGAAATLFISTNPKMFLPTDIMDDQRIVTDQGQQSSRCASELFTLCPGWPICHQTLETK